MYDFEKLKPAMLKWASRYSSNRFEFWELINESWLSSRAQGCNVPEVISIAVKRGMVDYVRDQLKYRKKNQPKFTAFSTVGEDFINFFQAKYDSKDEIDQEDFFDTLLKGFDRRDKVIIKAYYISGLNMREIAEVLGVTQSCISLRHKSIIERLRAKAVTSAGRTNTYTT